MEKHVNNIGKMSNYLDTLDISCVNESKSVFASVGVDPEKQFLSTLFQISF